MQFDSLIDGTPRGYAPENVLARICTRDRVRSCAYSRSVGPAHPLNYRVRDRKAAIHPGFRVFSEPNSFGYPGSCVRVEHANPH